MAKGFAAIHLIGHKGKLTLRGLGQTPRGQGYLKQVFVLEAATPADPKFKGELSTAVEKLLA